MSDFAGLDINQFSLLEMVCFQEILYVGFLAYYCDRFENKDYRKVEHRSPYRQTRSFLFQQRRLDCHTIATVIFERSSLKEDYQ